MQKRTRIRKTRIYGGAKNGDESTTTSETATHLPTTRALDQPGLNLAHEKKGFKLAEFLTRPLNMSFNNFFLHGLTGKND